MLVYDGDCGFCSSAARWIAGRLGEGHAVVPYQRLDELPAGLSLEDVRTAAYWIGADGPRRGHRAVSASLVAAGGVWAPVGRLLDVWPLRWLAAGAYAVVARYRYRLPGGTPACRRDA